MIYTLLTYSCKNFPRARTILLVFPEVQKYISLLEKVIFKLDIKTDLLFVFICLNNILQIAIENTQCINSCFSYNK